MRCAFASTIRSKTHGSQPKPTNVPFSNPKLRTTHFYWALLGDAQFRNTVANAPPRMAAHTPRTPWGPPA
ncbi:hypothetical protein M422DRAFT_253731 [Sphaerobolus stellatus SS14]|uniref:Uncharacterized protein n=1 Tax=Sphaerobolus stellatus (strain SS14) TaxID=990650 RepID=A0A0C9U807_SPHS4|nr:hypothetical protein M422DRAFT_258036 [Sphaerobolus stellatus SS14]KIJ42941.1 hypothetical protein M422DRAFT_253731 [Sphaerobolus stellatus SS14]